MGPGPRSNACCRLCFHTPFAGNSVVTIRFRRGFRSEVEEREVQALAWCQCETSRSAPGFVTRTSQTWSDEIRISRPVARVSGWSVGHASRRTLCPALFGLQLRQHELQRSTFVLLAQRRTSESDKNGSVGQSVADASDAERCVAGMEVADRIQ